MTITQINYFLTLAAAGSFSLAAERLYVSQPAVSKQISSLEAELGFLLFDRNERRIKITKNGQLMLECFERCRADIKKNLDDIYLGTRPAVNVNVGFLTRWNIFPLASRLTSMYAQTDPDLQFSFEGYSTTEIISALRNSHINIALTHDFVSTQHDDITVLNAGNIGCSITYAKAYFNFGGREPCISDFADAPLLISEETHPSFLENLRRISQKYGIGSEIRYCAREASLVTAMRCGKGVIIGSDFFEIRPEGVGSVPLGRDMTLTVCCMRNNYNSRKREIVDTVAAALRSICDSADASFSSSTM